jgi:lysophospholipase L1-like esterase
MKRFRPRRRAPPTSLLVARLGLALGITLLFFLGLELGLWALGRIPALRTGPTEPVAFDDSWTLVFTGDSVTYGLELPSSSSYPAQLARFEATRIAKARVHNLALPGQSLDDIAQQIRTFQQAAEPDTPTRIVVLGGINDCLTGPRPHGHSIVATPCRAAQTPAVLQSNLPLARPAAAADQEQLRLDAACE